MINCKEFQEVIVDLLYGEVKGEACESALKHREKCDSCREEWNQMLKVKSIMEALPSKSPSEALFQGLMGEANKTVPWYGSIRSFLNPVSSLIKANLAPVAVMGLLLFAFIHGVFDLKSWLSGDEVQVASDLSIPTSSVIQPVASMNPGMDEALNSLPYSNDMESLEAEDITQVFERRRQALQESDADTLLMRGRRFKTMGRMDLALRDFETIFRFYPTYTYMGDVLMYRAQCYAFLGHMDKALESLDVYKKRYPSKKALVEPMIEQLSQKP